MFCIFYKDNTSKIKTKLSSFGQNEICVVKLFGKKRKDEASKAPPAKSEKEERKPSYLQERGARNGIRAVF